MSAVSIKNLVGEDIWNGYFKFTIVRNPYDMLISRFAMAERKRAAETLVNAMIRKQLLGRHRRVDRVEDNTGIDRFRSWLRLAGSERKRKHYMIDGQVCVDYFMRFEQLHESIRHVCAQVGVPYEPWQIPEFKSGLRNTDIPVSAYYDDETRRIVKRNYAWELRAFGYVMPE